MKIKFEYDQDKEFPYQAQYVDWQSLPLIPRLGLGGYGGNRSKTYGDLLDKVIKDVQGYLLTSQTKDIETVFSEGIDKDLQNLTAKVLKLTSENVSLEKTLHQIHASSAISELNRSYLHVQPGLFSR